MTCRQEDYQRIVARPESPRTVFTSTVRILPLARRHARAALAQGTDGERRLLEVADRVPAVAELLCTPLWLSIAARVYRYAGAEDPLASLGPDADQAAVGQVLSARWLQLQAGARASAFRRHLGFLAVRMRANGQPTVHLEAVQPRWLPVTRTVRWVRAVAYAASTMLAIWLALGVAAAVEAATFGLSTALGGTNWPQSVLTVGVPAAIGAVIAHGGHVPATAGRTWRQDARDAALVLVAAGVLLGVLRLAGVFVVPPWFVGYSLYMWAVFRLATTGSESPRPVVAAARRLVPRRVLTHGNLTAGAMLGLGVGAYFFAVGTLGVADPGGAAGTDVAAGGLMFAVVVAAFLPHRAMVALPATPGRSQHPLGALWRSARTGLTTGIAVVPAVVVTVLLLTALNVALLLVAGLKASTGQVVAAAALSASFGVATAAPIWVPIAVVTALEGGLGAVVEHGAARAVAAAHGWLPLRLTSLFDAATAAGILYPAGPGWRFRHRTFADQLIADREHEPRVMADLV